MKRSNCPDRFPFSARFGLSAYPFFCCFFNMPTTPPPPPPPPPFCPFISGYPSSPFLLTTGRPDSVTSSPNLSYWLSLVSSNRHGVPRFLRRGQPPFRPLPFHFPRNVFFPSRTVPTLLTQFSEGLPPPPPVSRFFAGPFSTF